MPIAQIPLIDTCLNTLAILLPVKKLGANMLIAAKKYNKNDYNGIFCNKCINIHFILHMNTPSIKLHNSELIPGNILQASIPLQPALLHHDNPIRHSNQL